MSSPLPDRTVLSPEYHAAHLSFVRVALVEASANREPLLGKLHAYARDVTQAEQDRSSEVIAAARAWLQSEHGGPAFIANYEADEPAGRLAAALRAYDGEDPLAADEERQDG